MVTKARRRYHRIILKLLLLSPTIKCSAERNGIKDSLPLVCKEQGMVAWGVLSNGVTSPLKSCTFSEIHHSSKILSSFVLHLTKYPTYYTPHFPAGTNDEHDDVPGSLFLACCLLGCYAGGRRRLSRRDFILLVLYSTCTPFQKRA